MTGPVNGPAGGAGGGAYSTSGGAVFVGSTGSLAATDVEFTDNALIENEDNYAHGGAVFLSAGAIARFLRTSFTGNMAGVPPLTGTNVGGRGGAIYGGWGVSLTIEGCQFASNAADNGGAITFRAGFGTYLSITGTTFTGSRSSSSSSAAIYDIGGAGSHTDSSAVSAQPILVEPP